MGLDVVRQKEAFVGQSELFVQGRFNERRDVGLGKQAPVAFERTTITDCPEGGEAVSEREMTESAPPSVSV